MGLGFKVPLVSPFFGETKNYRVTTMHTKRWSLLRAALALGVWQIWGASSVCLWGRGLFCLVRKQYAYLTRAGHAMYMYAYKRHPYPQFLGLTYGIQVILSLPPRLDSACHWSTHFLQDGRFPIYFIFCSKGGGMCTKMFKMGWGLKVATRWGIGPLCPLSICHWALYNILFVINIIHY